MQYNTMQYYKIMGIRERFKNLSHIKIPLGGAPPFPLRKNMPFFTTGRKSVFAIIAWLLNNHSKSTKRLIFIWKGVLFPFYYFVWLCPGTGSGVEGELFFGAQKSEFRPKNCFLILPFSSSSTRFAPWSLEPNFTVVTPSASNSPSALSARALWDG